MTKRDISSGGLVTRQNMIHLGILLSITILQMGGMNLSAALQRISVNFPEQSMQTIQSLVTLPSLFIVFSSFASGPLASLISRKRTILLGSLFFTISGLLPTFFDSFALIRVSRILIGIGIGLITPLSSTLLFDFFTDPFQRNTMIGWSSCGSSIGSIIAVNLAGFLAGIDYHLAFLVHLMGMVTFFVNLALLPQDNVRHKEKSNEGIPIKEFFATTKPWILFWFICMFLYMGYLNAFSTKISLLVENSGVGTTAVSAMGITLLTIGGLVAGMLYGQISKILGKFTTGIGIIISAFGLLCLAICKSPGLVYASGLFTGLGMCMTTPRFLVGVVESSEKKFRTVVIAINSACSNLGLSLSPYLTSFTTALFFGAGKTIRNEYLVSSIFLATMGVAGLVMGLVKVIRRDDKEL